MRRLGRTLSTTVHASLVGAPDDGAVYVQLSVPLEPTGHVSTLICGTSGQLMVSMIGPKNGASDGVT